MAANPSFWMEYEVQISVGWVTMGTVAAGLAPVFLLGGFDQDRLVLKCVLPVAAIISALSLFYVSRRHRNHELLRIRQNWKWGVFANMIMSSIVVIHYYFQIYKSINDIIGHILIATFILAFVMIAKPVEEYGILQYFLQQPFIASIDYGNIKHEIVGWYHGLSFVVLLLGTLSQNYDRHAFVFAPNPNPNENPSSSPSRNTSPSPNISSISDAPTGRGNSPNREPDTSVDVEPTPTQPSQVEIGNSDVVEPDSDSDLPETTQDPSIEVTEENREAAEILKSSAMDAIFEGNLNEAVAHLTEAIKLNPKSALLHASRAGVFVKLKRPKAAIRAANAALEINPDLAKGYKARGMARALLGLWEEALGDLKAASKLDFDEETSMVLKKVATNVEKIEEHRLEDERLREERTELERLRREAENKYPELVSILRDGHVIGVSSLNDFRIKLQAANKLFRLAIVYFNAKWCGRCHNVSPDYTVLAGKYPKVIFLKIDIDDVVNAAKLWNVCSVPSFLCAKNGGVVDAEFDMDMDSLEKKIVRHAG